jgi:hypothetical protein
MQMQMPLLMQRTHFFCYTQKNREVKRTKRNEEEEKREKGEKKKSSVNDMKKETKRTPPIVNTQNMKTLKQQGIPESEASPSPD